MLHNPFSSGVPGVPPHTHGTSGKPSLQLPAIAIPSSISRQSSQAGPFSDARTHGFKGPSRAVMLPHAATPGAAAMSKNQAGDHCVVVGNGSIRILKISDGAERPMTEYKFSIGNGGFRIDASKNFWSGNGAKVDSALTDVVWCQKVLDTKIVTSSRNGELSLWDINRSGALKFERKTRAHMRSINKLSYSSVMPNYCCSGSSDGKLRLWDLRDPTRATHTIHNFVEIRSVLYSPTVSEPFSAVTGLENGSLCRWDFRVGQKGILERIPLAHTGAILTFDWCEQYESGVWLASGGLDRTVKVWNFSGSHTHGTSTPSYTLHVSNPVRRVTWRPGYETELAVAYYNESTFNPSLKTPQAANLSLSPASVHLSLEDNTSHPSSSSPGIDKGRQSSSMIMGLIPNTSRQTGAGSSGCRSGELVEMWDVRRPWLAKWTVNDSNTEGGVTDMTFADSHALWVQNSSGAFSQMDLRDCDKPIDSIPRSAATWNLTGSLTFASDQPSRGTIPYDDRAPDSKPGERSEIHKKLGDRRFMPSSQSVGTIHASDDEDWESFIRLAQGYKIEGCDKLSLCEHNAQVAFESSCPQAGQIWLLLQSLLLDIETHNPPPQLSQKMFIPTLPHSSSAPAAVPRVNRSPNNKPPTQRSSDDEPMKSGQASETLLATSTTNDSESNQSHLPHPNGSDVQKAKSIAVGTLGRPRRELLRQRSLSKPARDHDRSTSSTARRNVVGEGALGDSDSSEDELAHTSASKTSPMGHDLDPFSSVPTRIQNRLVSSPMVRDGEWAEDEREESTEDSDSDSVSGSESDTSNASTTAARSNSHRRPTRSRSSTIAAMPASAFLRPQPFLSRTDSYSSVQTVTMGNGATGSPATFGSKWNTQSLRHREDSPPQSVSVVDNGRDRDAQASPVPSRKSVKKRLSQGIISSGNQALTQNNDKSIAQDPGEVRFLEWNHVAIKEAEKAYRLATWDALRSSVAALADSGEIQLCATLCCIARSELGIPPVRALMFLESYIDMLTRLQLFTVLAYFRKYAPTSKIREASQVMTTVYTSCSSCGKPIIDAKAGQAGRHSFSQCSKCKKTTLCTICHLPVHTMLMACMICSHGGHRDCYLRYYLGRPMVVLPQPGQDQQRRGRRPLRTADSHSYGEDNEAPGSLGLESDISGGAGSQREDGKNRMVRMTGHLCASGCGHVCWAASERMVSL